MPDVDPADPDRQAIIYGCIEKRLFTIHLLQLQALHSLYHTGN
jgi:hypothetical protein